MGRSTTRSSPRRTSTSRSANLWNSAGSARTKSQQDRVRHERHDLRGALRPRQQDAVRSRGGRLRHSSRHHRARVHACSAGSALPSQKLMPNNDKRRCGTRTRSVPSMPDRGRRRDHAARVRAQHYSPTEYRQWYKIQVAPAKGPALPKALDRDDYFPYNEGFKFVWKLYHMGGMSRIDKVYANLPNSTYVIMYPNAYLSGWKPVLVVIHHVLGMTGWKQVDDDVFGAWDYKLLLWRRSRRSTPTRLPEPIGATGYVFLEKGASNAYLLRSVWSSHAAAIAVAVTRIPPSRSASHRRLLCTLRAARRRSPHPAKCSQSPSQART